MIRGSTRDGPEVDRRRFLESARRKLGVAWASDPWAGVCQATSTQTAPGTLTVRRPRRSASTDLGIPASASVDVSSRIGGSPTLSANRAVATGPSTFNWKGSPDEQGRRARRVKNLRLFAGPAKVASLATGGACVPPPGTSAHGTSISPCGAKRPRQGISIRGRLPQPVRL
jgi:hypothetical protein